MSRPPTGVGPSMSRRPPPGEEGLILVNVLLFVAIAASIVMLMIAAEDGALARAARSREAARALAIAHGGELSAITALRRDGVMARDNDNAAEPWARLATRNAPIEGGAFELAIADATGRFNVNAVMSGDAAAVVMLQRIAETAGMTRDMAVRAVAMIRLYGPVTDLRPLERAGLDPRALARLAPLVTALPFDSRINVNAASEELLGILLDDPMAAARLVAQRNRRGYLTEADFAAENAQLPAGTALTSDLYWVRARVRVGDTAQQLTSLLLRRRRPDGSVDVLPVGRWLGRAPSQAPALS